jgi:hypothetical protein
MKANVYLLSVLAGLFATVGCGKTVETVTNTVHGAVDIPRALYKDAEKNVEDAKETMKSDDQQDRERKARRHEERERN